MIPIRSWLSYDERSGKLFFTSSTEKGRKWNKSHPGKEAGHINRKGYIGIFFEGRHWKAHRLIATHLIPNPNKYPEINHINGIKSDNRLENLEWVTSSENVRHSFDIGLNVGKARDLNAATKLSSGDVVKIKQMYVKGSRDFGSRGLGKLFGVSHTAILHALKEL